jgi:uncharacterized protein (UPF0333 family)
VEIPLDRLCLNHDSITGSYVSAKNVVDIAEAKVKEEAEQAAKDAIQAAANKVDKILSNSANGGPKLLGSHHILIVLSGVFAVFCTL